MAGTIAGGLKAAETNKRNNPDFYRQIGGIGGKRSRTGGFAAEVACNCKYFPYQHFVKNCAGKKGGSKSTRKGVKNVR